MANFNGKFMKCWKIEDKGNFKLVDLGDSYKKDGEYQNFTWFRVAFVGEAARKQINEKDTIEVTQGQIKQEKYQDKWYTKVTVFDFEVTRKAEQPQEKAYDGNLEGFSSFDTSGISDDSCPF